MNFKLAIKNILSENFEVSRNKTIEEYSKWKRKNVTLRGMKQTGVDNGVVGSWGKGYYTVPLSNRAMAKQYGDVYFIVNAIPQKPKIVNSVNDAEILRYELIEKFCKDNGLEKHHFPFYYENGRSMEKDLLEMGYDGFVIKGREMVHYKPENIKVFKTEIGLKEYYESLKSRLTESVSQNYSESSTEEFQEALSALNSLDLEDDEVRIPKYDEDTDSYIDTIGRCYLYVRNRDELPSAGPFEIFVLNADDEIMGFFRGTKNQSLISFNLVYFKDEFRGLGYGTDIYKYFLDNNYIIKSDSEITDSTESLYLKLSKEYKTLLFSDGSVGLKK